MTRLFSTIVLILALGAPAAAIAQRDDSTPDLYPGVEGIETSYARFITAMPDAMPIINILGMSFDTKEHAQTFHHGLVEATLTDLDETELPPGAVLESTDIEPTNVDDDVEVARVTALGGEDAYAMVFTFIRIADTTFVVFVVASSDDEALSFAQDTTTFILESEPETDTVSFSEDGTSTGGVFDRMPSADDELVPDSADIVDIEEIAAGDRA